MPRVGVRIGVVALAFVTIWPSPPATAFGLNVGPLHLQLPLPGVRGRALHHRHEIRATATPSELAQNRAPDLLYPILALPSLFDEIFRPTTSSPWPFSYQDIFDQAFAKYPTERIAELCRPSNDRTDIARQIGRQIMPTAAQRALLQKLGAALAQADGYMLKSCLSEVPSTPVGRLQLMESQIDAMIMALEVVRVPLQDFEQSLNERQRARYMPRATNAGANSASGDDAVQSCRHKPEPANWPLAPLEQAIQPSDDQRSALRALEQAFNRAASDLGADCPDRELRTPSERLQAIEARLDITWQAVQTIQVALAQFQGHLTEQQSVRSDELELAASQ